MSGAGQTWSLANHFTANSPTPVAHGSTKGTSERAGKAARIVFVPGLWHTAYHAGPLVDVLSRKGVPITPVQLASVGRKDQPPSFADDVAVIRDNVMKLIGRGEDVILVLHSYAGMPGSEAVNQIIEQGGLQNDGTPGRGKLKCVVYIAAHMFPAGFMMDAKLFVGPENPRFQIMDDDISIMLEPYEVFFNDMTISDAQPYLDALDVTYYLGGNDRAGPCIQSENYRTAPMLYMRCEQDAAIPLERQEMVSQGMEVVSFNAGHDPFISQPENVAEVLEKVAWKA